MPGPHKGVSTQHTTQQQFAKPRNQTLDRDQQTRDRLRNKISESKAKIRSCAYLQLGDKVLQTIHQTFEPNIPVIFHLLTLTNTTVDTDTAPTLFVIQEGIHCMPATDYYFTNIQPEPIIVSPTEEITPNRQHNMQQLRIQFHNKLTHCGQVKPEFILPCYLINKSQC